MRCWARTATSTSFAFRRTRRCRDTPGCVRRGNSAAMPPALRGPHVVAPAIRLWGRSRIQLVLALEEDQFEVLSFGADGEPAGVPGQLVVRALLEPEHFRVELESSLLVAHNDGHVGHFLDHGLTLRDSITLRLFNHLLISVSPGLRSVQGRRGIEPDLQLFRPRAIHDHSASRPLRTGDYWLSHLAWT